MSDAGAGDDDDDDDDDDDTCLPLCSCSTLSIVSSTVADLLIVKCTG